MKKILSLFVCAAVIAGCNMTPTAENDTAKSEFKSIEIVKSGNVDFENFFENKTMRVDYFHTGMAHEESFAVDRIISDGQWGGSTNILIDELELGLYFYEVIDKETKTLLFSRGFASIFGEWQTIPEAKEKQATFHESVRFPWPKNEVTLIMSKRNAENNFEQIWSTDIDPSSRQVNPADRISEYKIDVIHESGSAQEKLDFVVLGDGYSADEMDKFVADAKRLCGALLNAEPFNSRKNDINIMAIETPAQRTGVTKPHPGVFNRTPLSVQYSSFDSERYALSYDNKAIRDIASAVPYEFMIILVNEATYGGGGIYNLYTTQAVDNKFSEYIIIHEMGHHLAALADEYYTSSVSYEFGEITKEPWETNVTALLDKENLKWKHLVDEETPIPTPWNKEEFDAHGYEIQKERDSLRAAKVPESVVEDLFVRQLNKESEYFNKEEYKDKVGAFEGANYMQYGYYRSQIDCIMYTRHTVFCKVCQESINNVIDQYTK